MAMVLGIPLALVGFDSGGAVKPTGSSAAALPPCPVATTKRVAPKGSSASDPIVGTVSVRPGPVSVLTAVVSVSSPGPVRLDILARSPKGTVRVPETDTATTHEVPLLGLEAATTYGLDVVATTTAETSSTVHVTFRTGSLPRDIPPVSTTVSVPKRTAPGFTLFNAIRGGNHPRPRVGRFQTAMMAGSSG